MNCQKEFTDFDNHITSLEHLRIQIESRYLKQIDVIIEHLDTKLTLSKNMSDSAYHFRKLEYLDFILQKQAKPLKFNNIPRLQVLSTSLNSN
jgi:hypothetical protein